MAGVGARGVGQAVGLGARRAEPGEFTMRAFLNHRIDLAQAQGVRDLIDYQTAYQARLATRQLDGALSRRIGPLKELLMEVIVHQQFFERDRKSTRLNSSHT